MKKTRPPIKRVNLSLTQHVIYLVSMLARRDDVSLTTKATELLEQGLEAEEDRIFLEMAEERLMELEHGKVKPLSSTSFWKAVEKNARKL